MKKILMVINGFQVFHNDLDYAIHIARKEEATLCGLFVHSLIPRELDGYALVSDINLAGAIFPQESGREEMLQRENAQIKLFEEVCISRGVRFISQPIHESFLDALIDQSAFADLMIINAEVNTTYYSLNSLLTNLYCPVLLLSKEAVIFDKVIIAYDGHSSSTHAMHQFAYLFSEWHHLPVYLVSVLPEHASEIGYNEQVKDWLKLQFQDVHINVLKGDVKEELPLFISLNQNALVVMGSFGRSSLSRFFKESLANVVLAKTKAALFIAHR